MNLLFDTNIFIHLAKDSTQKLLEQLNPNHEKTFASIVTIAELKSIAIQNNWGYQKQALISALLEEMVIIEVNENLADTYAEIDAYSQCRNPSFSEYSF